MTSIPELLQADDIRSWKDTADVIVIGLGIAGGVCSTRGPTGGCRRSGHRTRQWWRRREFALGRDLLSGRWHCSSESCGV